MKEKTERIKTDIILAAVAFVTALLRIFYVIKTPHWLRQHDVISFGAGEGQASFIEYFYNGNVLLDFDPRTKWGFFQPPLHHMLSALWMRLQVFFGTDYDVAGERVQVLTLVYSLVALLFAYFIFRKLGLKGRELLFAFTLSALHPGFTLMSGSINNDMLCIMFSVMLVYFALVWYETPTLGYTLLLALLMGLGMMTKLSCVLLAPALAVLFIIAWVEGGREKFFMYLRRYIAFLAVCAPLGLWSPVRNYLKFGVPLGYTPEVGEAVYAGLFARIFDIRTVTPFVALIDRGSSYDEFNMFLGMMKTSLFGDQDFAHVLEEAGHVGMLRIGMIILAWILLLSAIVLAAVCFYATIRVLISSSFIGIKAYRAFFGVLYAVSVAAYVSFMLKATYYSSMDFRYVLYLIPVEALMCGLYLKEAGRIYRYVSYAALLLFSLSSVGVYTILLTFG